MKIYNPTKNPISIIYKGGIYSVDALSETVGIPEEVATHWKSIHAFIQINKEEEVKKEEIKKEVVVEIPEEVKESVVSDSIIGKVVGKIKSSNKK